MFFIFNFIENFSEQKNLQALTLVGPPRDKPELDPLATPVQPTKFINYCMLINWKIDSRIDHDLHNRIYTTIKVD